MELKISGENLGEYDYYFDKFQSDSENRLNFLIQRQFERENISDENSGIAENIRASCREILREEICQ